MSDIGLGATVLALRNNCIRLGNAVYGSARSSLQIRLFFAVEAANMLEGSVDVKVDAPLPVRI